MGRVIVRPLAQSDRDALWDRIADDQDEEAADHFLRKIYHRLNILGDHPLLGTARDDIKPGLRGSPVGRYILFFYPLDDGIILSRVIFGGRDLANVYEDDEP